MPIRPQKEQRSNPRWIGIRHQSAILAVESESGSSSMGALQGGVVLRSRLRTSLDEDDLEPTQATDIAGTDLTKFRASFIRIFPGT